MPITYTTLLTDVYPAPALGGGQARVYRGYAIGSGIILNAVATMTIGGHTIQVLDNERFIPGLSLAHLLSLAWTTVDTVDLGLGQKRYVRNYSVLALAFPFAPMGTLVEVLKTAIQQMPNAVEMLTSMQINWAPV